MAKPESKAATEIENYTKSLCLHLRVDYDSVIQRGKSNFNTGERVVRHLVVQKFHGRMPLKELAAIIGTTPSSICYTKRRFKRILNYSPAFQEAIKYLEELGVIELRHPPKTKELAQRLDISLEHIEKLLTMLQKQKEEIYEIKKSLPKVWEF
jgi:hypothetical protein